MAKAYLNNLEKSGGRREIQKEGSGDGVQKNNAIGSRLGGKEVGDDTNSSGSASRGHRDGDVDGGSNEGGGDKSVSFKKLVNQGVGNDGDKGRGILKEKVRYDLKKGSSDEAVDNIGKYIHLMHSNITFYTAVNSTLYYLNFLIQIT